MNLCEYEVAVSKETLSSGTTVYYVWHPAMTGCCAHGETLEEAIAELRDVRRIYQQALMADGLPIPPAHVVPFDGGAAYYFSVEC